MVENGHLAEICDQIERDAKADTPLRGTGGLKRMAVTGSLGVPIWLHDLLHEAGWGASSIECIELGGRGVKHPRAGWVSVDELRALAEE